MTTESGAAAPAIPRMAESAVHQSVRADVAVGNGTIEQHNEWLVRNGYTAISNSGGSVPQTPAAANPASVASAESSRPDAPGGDPIPTNLTIQQERFARQAAAERAAAGYPGEAGAYLASLGLKPYSPAMQQRVDEDRAGGMATTPEEFSKLASSYEMPPIVDPDTGDYSDKAMEIDLSLRETMARAGFDRSSGSFFLEEAARFEPQWQAMAEGERLAHRTSEDNQLRRVWGDKYAENRKAVVDFVDRLAVGKPEIIDWLRDTGAGSSALLMQQLFARLQAGRHGILEHRNKSRS